MKKNFVKSAKFFYGKNLFKIGRRFIKDYKNELFDKYKLFEHQKNMMEYNKESANYDEKTIWEKIETFQDILTPNDLMIYLDKIVELNEKSFSDLSKKKEFQNFMKILKIKLTTLEKEIIPYSIIETDEKEQDLEKLLKWVENQNKRLEINKKKPLIGRLAIALKKLNYIDTEIWFLMEKYLLSDKILKTFNDSVDAIEGFTIFKQILINYETAKMNINKNALMPVEQTHLLVEDKVNKRMRNLFKKLEYNMLVSLLDTNVKYYERIIRSLVETNSPNEISYEAIENHVINNLSFDHDLEMSFSLYYHFALAAKGSKNLFEQIEIILHIGSKFDYFQTQKKFIQNNFNNAEKLGKFLEATSLVQSRYEDYEVNINNVTKINKAINNLTNLDATLLDLKKILFFIPALKLTGNENNKILGKVLDKSISVLAENNCEKEKRDFLLFLPDVLNQDLVEYFFRENKGKLGKLNLDMKEIEKRLIRENIYIEEKNEKVTMGEKMLDKLKSLIN